MFITQASPGASVTSWLGPTWERPSCSFVGGSRRHRPALSGSEVRFPRAREPLDLRRRVAARVVSQQKRINNSAASSEPEAESRLSLSLVPSLSQCDSHSHYCKGTVNKARYTRTHAGTHTRTHLDLLPWYVHDLTPASKAFEHRACCHASAPPFALLSCSGNSYSRVKLYRKLHKQFGSSRTSH